MMSLIECASWMKAMMRICALHLGHSTSITFGRRGILLMVYIATILKSRVYQVRVDTTARDRSPLHPEAFTEVTFRLIKGSEHSGKTRDSPQ